MSITNLDLRTDEDANIELNADRDFNWSLYAYWISGTTRQDRGEVGFDFSTYTGATMEVKTNFTSSNIILSFSTDDSSITLPSSGSSFQLYKSAEQLSLIRGGKYEYDMYLHKAGELKRAFLRGQFIIHNQITN